MKKLMLFTTGIFLILNVSLVPAVFAEEDPIPVVCINLDTNEKNVATPVVPEMGINKIFLLNLKNEGIQVMDSCDNHFFGKSDGRMK